MIVKVKEPPSMCESPHINDFYIRELDKDNEKDKEKLIKEAEDYLSKDKKKKPADLSPSALGFEYISLLVSLFNDVVNGKIT